MVNDRSNRMYISTEIEAAGLTVILKLDGAPAICTVYTTYVTYTNTYTLHT